MDNAAYLDKFAPHLTPERRQLLLDVMHGYGENKWWLSEDLRTVAYHQLHENRLLVDFSKFHKGVELLLGRPVWTHEFGLCRNQLLFEAEMAWRGKPFDEREKAEAVCYGMKRLKEVAGDRLVVMVPVSHPSATPKPQPDP